MNFFETERGDKKSVAENYVKTIETLIDFGAEPEVANRSGVTVSDLLQEFCITSLSLLVAKKITHKFFDGDTNATLKHDNFMLLKDSDGNVKLIPKTVSQNKEDKDMPKRQATSNGQGDVQKVLTVNFATPANSLVSTLDPETSETTKPLTMSKEIYFTYAGPKQRRILPKNVNLRKVNQLNSRQINKLSNQHIQLNSQANLANASYYIVNPGQGNVSLTPGNNVANKLCCPTVSLTTQNTAVASNANSPNVCLTTQNTAVTSNVNSTNVSLTAQDIAEARNINYRKVSFSTNVNLTGWNAKPQSFVPNNVKSAAVRPSNTTSKRSASPRNVSLPELSKTEKCQKRKSRILTTEKEGDDRKKLKTPE